ncbi:MAG: ATP-dependent Clp protease ATP-binding subunit ClpX [Selenomonas ruminantium]|nr:ATP-dependent Clp protease ATP-binding subunit ClpX [Selenomonas ruminantium]
MAEKTSAPQVRCTMCKRVVTVHDQYDMPIYDPGTGFAICKSCIRDINHFLDEHDMVSAEAEHHDFSEQLTEILGKNKPHKIKEYLDEYIINQDRAKKVLSVAVYNHYKRMKYGYQEEETEIEKSNVIMLGPSGCGKTALLSHLSKLLDIPFAVTDASSLTEAGFVGADVEVAVRNLYYAADKDIEKAEHGIIYLDEFDKIARKSGANNSITADPGHEGVQQALLKMLEGSVVEFTARGQRKHPEAPTIKVDTKNILFIVGGAFVGIDKVINKRLKKSESGSIGFGAEVKGEADQPKFDELIHQVRPEDLMEYGIIPEIIGRLPVICTLETLDEDALLRILTEPKNAPVKQYEKLLAMDGVTLRFEEDALRAVAKKAIERKTGARSLKGIIEDTMLDVMFDIPRSDEKREVVITEKCITEGAQPEVKPVTA